MMPVWGLLGYTYYSLTSKMEEFKEDVADVAENTMINFLLDNVLNASRGMGLAIFLCGDGLSSYRVVRTMTTVGWSSGRGEGPERACGALYWYSVHVLWQAQVLIEGAGPQHQVPAELGGGG